MRELHDHSLFEDDSTKVHHFLEEAACRTQHDLVISSSEILLKG